MHASHPIRRTNSYGASISQHGGRKLELKKLVRVLRVAEMMGGSGNGCGGCCMVAMLVALF
jgi:hypothetical protein